MQDVLTHVVQFTSSNAFSGRHIGFIGSCFEGSGQVLCFSFYQNSCWLILTHVVQRQTYWLHRCCFAGSAAALSRLLLQSQLLLHSCYCGHSPVHPQGWLLAAPTQTQAKVRGVVVRLTLTASSAQNLEQMRGLLESTPTSFAGPGTRTGSRGASQRWNTRNWIFLIFLISRGRLPAWLVMWRSGMWQHDMNCGHML